MKRVRKLVAGLCLAAMLCTGCGQNEGPASVKDNAVVISDKGEVTAYVVGEFDKSYYDMEELKDMAAAEAGEYSQMYGEGGSVPVSVEKVEPVAGVEGKVTVTYLFDSADSYSRFWGQFVEDGQLFFGTVSQAQEKGYISGVTLENVKDGTSMTGEGLKQYGDRHLIITNAKADIYCPSRVTHVSRGAVMNEDGSVGTFQAQGTVYILLK